MLDAIGGNNVYLPQQRGQVQSAQSTESMFSVAVEQNVNISQSINIETSSSATETTATANDRQNKVQEMLEQLVKLLALLISGGHDKEGTIAKAMGGIKDILKLDAIQNMTQQQSCEIVTSINMSTEMSMSMGMGVYTSTGAMSDGGMGGVGAVGGSVNATA